ncbi:MAG: hypothetical protein KJO54_08950 [Gammaproteobacteria bacterium]|nr:hypothetical protein [Gammaproteobacteria bacterium]NNF60505.1 hypothetical protein [Gammaproteobacteria bacterium]
MGKEYTFSSYALLTAVSVVLAALLLQPTTVLADTVDEIKKEILDGNAFVRKNLRDKDGGISKRGSLQFWSSGGLSQVVAADAPISEYEQFSLTPKHIQVVVLDEGKSAVAMYYSEGSFHEKGSEPVAHYMTRITEVFVKEGKNWVVRAAHYSPIAAGSGTRQSSID